jgi:tRNA-specific 2-thiouridylase
LFVVRLDAANAQVVVGPREALETRSIELRDVNWIGDDEFASISPAGISILARVRSTRPPVFATLTPHADGATVTFVEGEYGVSPGQACVFYDGEGSEARVLGGGFIANAAPASETLRRISVENALSLSREA